MVQEIITTATLAFFDAVFAEKFNEWRRNNISRARELAIKEAKKYGANIESIAAQDDTLSAFYRFGQAAIEGAGEKNLRVIMQLILGNHTKRLVTTARRDTLIKVIAELNEEELITLVKLYNYTMVEKETHISASEALYEELGKESTLPILMRLQATGLLVTSSGLDSIMYSTSSLMDEIVKLTELVELSS